MHMCIITYKVVEGSKVVIFFIDITSVKLFRCHNNNLLQTVQSHTHGYVQYIEMFLDNQIFKQPLFYIKTFTVQILYNPQNHAHFPLKGKICQLIVRR